MKLSLASAAVLTALTLTACGTQDGSTENGGTASDPSGTASSPAATAIEHPTGPDDVVLRIEAGGGFVPYEYAFTNQPTLLLTGDGRLIVPAGAEDDFGNRYVPLEVVQVDEDLVQQLLELARDHGLLGSPPDYEMDEGQAVSDAPTTTVTITTTTTYTHAAYALSFDGPGDTKAGPRADLADFIDEAVALVPDGGTPYEPEQVRLLATEAGGEPEGATVLDWDDADVGLATVQQCAVADAADLPSVLGDADAQTYFRQAGVVYTVAGAAVLPGEEPCASS